MNSTMRRVVIGTAAISMALSVAACGEAGSDAADSDKKSIGILLPENKTTRYETFDRPLMEKKIKALCSDCEISYNNANQETELQKKQFDALITKGVKVIILDAVDATATKSWVDAAAKKGVKVVAYDRLAEGDVSAYVSYDNEKIGELQGEAVLQALGDKAEDSELVMINGSPTDPNAALFKKGAHTVLDGKVKKIVYEQDIPDWSPDEANKKMAAAITTLGKDGFDAVYSANDGMAGGIITALKSRGIKDVPVGGQDSELAGLQRIVAGSQTFTIYKGIKPEAERTAEIAVALLNGESIDEFTEHKVDSKSKKGIPSQLFDATVVTKDNIKDTLIADKVYTVDQICTTEFEAACKDAGLL
ncbi:substrate-binding domain-containing protein [Streptomyces sp. WAC 00631]|uniref:sugar ABC transporter substrate-binding protein n=1 Tax=unclassified Streptomyces TaxID=2593676 RepID=UPI00163CF22E|nr:MULTISPECIES: substrate-binding domain-containing protein [unclassified Streptomyces]MCC5036089.1 substrate-binding domain-containing protein [Streptomyces sp. WAC 00631]MCC9738885.1 substrate-binding domain-containing protein [Streptomyces sp. MNU89]